ncbi:thiamine ABC transporter substrate-binding protein [Natronolimnobius sp. AArcel1]|uniref:thiamine ABC transporter substrate-binding protein n=1 Tax=Natronolimnobius sp. AArcel1 TaxID=1679093 RepID=UPI0013EDB668|nr:thiamine ABC transporter substrate-binding protein [Natronolimnobius sp. AArcel1]NGM68700.1 thiamine ABC transporter substrate-binding protein [Natronolimnobius sp. AArcel1]
MNRRAFVRRVGVGSSVGVAGLAGCFTREESDDPQEDTDNGPADDALRVATYSSMVTGETSAGAWLKETFEEEYDADLRWRVPEAGIDHFIRRGELETSLGADVYLGLTAGDLVRIDDALSAGALFERIDREVLEHDQRIRSDLAFDDPANRVLPFETGYLSLIFDENEFGSEPPETFDALLEEDTAGTLLAQDPRTSNPGLAFLLWTIAEYGDDYLEYWQALADNGLEVHDNWSDAYRTYLAGERPLVVSYSSDPVGAAEAGRDLTRHQTTSLEGQYFQVTEGIGVFETTPRPELAYEFIDFVLSETAQAELALRNVQYPAVDEAYVELPAAFDDLGDEPTETQAVTADYDDLSVSLPAWLEEWETEFGDEWADVTPPEPPETDDETDETVFDNATDDMAAEPDTQSVNETDG